MRGLNKYPFSFWLCFSIVIAYLIYNPIYSLQDFMTLDIFWGLKVIVGGFFCGVVLLYISEGAKTVSPMGLLVLCAILGAAISTALHSNWLSYGTIGWWIQIPVGIAMTFALRWGSIYRSITGRVPVGTGVDHDAPSGHH